MVRFIVRAGASRSRGYDVTVRSPDARRAACSRCMVDRTRVLLRYTTATGAPERGTRTDADNPGRTPGQRRCGSSRSVKSRTAPCVQLPDFSVDACRGSFCGIPRSRGERSRRGGRPKAARSSSRVSWSSSMAHHRCERSD